MPPNLQLLNPFTVSFSRARSWTKLDSSILATLILYHLHLPLSMSNPTSQKDQNAQNAVKSYQHLMPCNLFELRRLWAFKSCSSEKDQVAALA